MELRNICNHPYLSQLNAEEAYSFALNPAEFAFCLPICMLITNSLWVPCADWCFITKTLFAAFSEALWEAGNVGQVTTEAQGDWSPGIVHFLYLFESHSDKQAEVIFWTDYYRICHSIWWMKFITYLTKLC